MKPKVAEIPQLKQKIKDITQKNIDLTKERNDQLQEMNEILEMNTQLQDNITASKVLVDANDSINLNLETSSSKRYCFDDNREHIADTQNSTGPVKISCVSGNGEYIELVNIYSEDISLAGLKIVQTNDKETSEILFTSDEIIPANSNFKIFPLPERKLLKFSGNLKTQLIDDANNLASDFALTKVPKSRLQNLASYIIPRFLRT